MKTYILMRNDTNPKTAEDIQVNQIYGIYQNRCKSFWECKLANIKYMKEMKSNNPQLFKSYIIKEIDLETSQIINSYNMVNRNQIEDESDNKFKIPTFYSEIENHQDNIVIA